jgi:light-regulated signal transduction histidine kinase (bacteriophytochrome)
LDNVNDSMREAGAEVTHDALPLVRSDASGLTQVFQNLVGNAIKFHGSEPPRIHVSALLEDEAWRLSVKDNGIGIRREYFDRIFTVFQRLHTRNEYPGTGIGLAICKKVIERHGGRIWLESEPGHGSTFHFTIPEQ